MAFIETWTQNYNVAPSNVTSYTTISQSYCSQLVAQLVTAGWTVVQYSSGGSVTTGTSQPAASTYTWAASGSTHSWIALVSPTGFVVGQNNTSTGTQSQVWFTIDCNSANVYVCSFAFHNTAPSGGTITAAPTSTNQLVYPAQQFIASTYTLINAVFHFLVTSTGYFVSMITITGTGYVPFCLAILPTTGSQVSSSTGYAYPYQCAIFCSYIASGGVFGCDNIGSNNGISLTGYSTFNHFITSPNRNYYYGATLLTGYLTTWKGWNFDGSSASISTQYLSDMLNPIGTVATLLASTTASTLGSLVGATLPSTGDAWAGDYYTSPIYVYTVTTSKTAYIGQIADITVSGQSLATNSGNNQTPSSVWLGQTGYAGAWFPSSTQLSL